MLVVHQSNTINRVSWHIKNDFGNLPKSLKVYVVFAEDRTSRPADT
jgi:hypothetical protein